MPPPKKKKNTKTKLHSMRLTVLIHCDSWIQVNYTHNTRLLYWQPDTPQEAAALTVLQAYLELGLVSLLWNLILRNRKTKHLSLNDCQLPPSKGTARLSWKQNGMARSSKRLVNTKNDLWRLVTEWGLTSGEIQTSPYHMSLGLGSVLFQ